MEAITISYDKLVAELNAVPEKDTRKKELVGHAKDTMMSVHDLLAYLVGWGLLVIKWIDRKDNNLAVDFPETGYKWNELGQLAQKFYRDHEKEEFSALLKKLEQTTARILKIISARSEKALYKDPWYEHYTLGRMIQLNTASPFKNAKDRLRKWKKQ